VRIAVVADQEGGGLLQAVADDGTPAGPVERVADLSAAVGERERLPAQPRWLWAATDELYPALLRAGMRVARCHDLALTEAILLAIEGRYGEPRSLRAGWARLRGLPVPDDPPPSTGIGPGGARGGGAGQAALFEPDRPGLAPAATAELLEAVVAVHAGQQRRLAAIEHGDPELEGLLGLLIAAESAGALAAAEMGHTGLPWRPDVHDALLTELLGPRPPRGALPRRLCELADKISAAFGGRRVNPDSPAQVLRAFSAAGLPVSSTRSFVLRGLDHPAVPLLLAYKELSRLHAAHGWSWLDTWVRAGRFHPEYVPGGVVSGRWATRGGGALQIPKAVRRAVVADPGWTFVVADAAQLEPRVLAALSGDLGLARAAGTGDLYAALAAEAFGGQRSRAKLALLGAIYGQTTGEGGQFLGVLRRRFPAAVDLVESAARAGEAGRVVRSRLGRTCPPPSARWRALTAGSSLDPDAGAGPAFGTDTFPGHDPDQDQDEDRPGPAAARRTARNRGRFTRNFVVQASAADWALVLLAALRRRLATPAELVFFQHDEVVVHCPQQTAEAVAETVTAVAEEARQLVFGATPVRFPFEIATVTCYADAK